MHQFKILHMAWVIMSRKNVNLIIYTIYLSVNYNVIVLK